MSEAIKNDACMPNISCGSGNLKNFAYDKLSSKIRVDEIMVLLFNPSFGWWVSHKSGTRFVFKVLPKYSVTFACANDCVISPEIINIEFDGV